MRKVVLFNNKFFPAFGGMESHFINALDYFKNDCDWICEIVVSKQRNKHIILNADLEVINEYTEINAVINDIYQKYNGQPCVFFFNNGVWIEELEIISACFPEAILIQRTGGNEFIKAPLEQTLPMKESQGVWAKNINSFLDRIISNSDYTSDRLKKIGVMNNKITKVRGGVNALLCKENIKEREVNRKYFDKINNTSKKILVTAAARLVQFKGIEMLIEGINASRYKDNIFFLCVGNGPLYQELVSKCRNMFSDKNFMFTGDVDYETSLKFISISDIYCSTSKESKVRRGNEEYIHTETMGRSILEAICQNVFVISTDVGGANEWFEIDREIGMLLEKNDIKHIKEGIDYTIANMKYLTTDNLLYNIYDWQIVFDKYKEIWDGIINEKYTVSNI